MKPLFFKAVFCQFATVVRDAGAIVNLTVSFSSDDDNIPSVPCCLIRNLCEQKSNFFSKDFSQWTTAIRCRSDGFLLVYK